MDIEVAHLRHLDGLPDQCPGSLALEVDALSLVLNDLLSLNIRLLSCIHLHYFEVCKFSEGYIYLIQFNIYKKYRMTSFINLLGINF